MEIPDDADDGAGTGHGSVRVRLPIHYTDETMPGAIAIRTARTTAPTDPRCTVVPFLMGPHGKAGKT